MAGDAVVGVDHPVPNRDRALAFGGAGDDRLVAGKSVDDKLQGVSRADVLQGLGGSDRDRLVGGDNDDFLEGGSDADTMGRKRGSGAKRGGQRDWWAN